MSAQKKVLKRKLINLVWTMFPAVLLASKAQAQCGPYPGNYGGYIAHNCSFPRGGPMFMMPGDWLRRSPGSTFHGGYNPYEYLRARPDQYPIAPPEDLYRKYIGPPPGGWRGEYGPPPGYGR